LGTEVSLRPNNDSDFIAAVDERTKLGELRSPDGGLQVGHLQIESRDASWRDQTAGSHARRQLSLFLEKQHAALAARG